METRNSLAIKKPSKVVLYIDTSSNKKVCVFLEIDHKKKEIIKKTDSWTSQILLPLINKLFLENNISFSRLNEVKVNLGPGSFTGLRVGVAVANALSWLLHIPVNGKKDRFAEPVYN